MFRIRIADLNVHFEAHDADFFAGRFAGYPAASGNPDVVIRSRLEDEPSLPEGEIYKTCRDAVLVRLPDGRRCHAIRGPREGVWLIVNIYTPDYSEVEVIIRSTLKHPVFSLTKLEYMYTGVMFTNRLTTLGGVSLHSSCLSYKGQAIAFSANSGTGKSTHTGLWKSRFGDDVVIINDDKPAIRFAGGGVTGDAVTVYGTPWSGKSDLNAAVSAPLRGVVFLEQAAHNSIRPLSAAESLYQFTAQISRPYYDARIGELTLGAIEKIISSVPVYMLSCDISQEAVTTVYDRFFGN